MQAAINSIQSGKKVIYIDTEGFSSTRFLQISKNNPVASKGMFLYRVMDLPDQEVAVIKAEKLIEKDREIDLLVMDSFTALMRLERDDGARNNSQMKQLKILNAISTEYDIGILITNQIYFDIGGGHTTPYGGFFLDHFSKVILELQKEKDGRRTITVKKHRALQDEIYMKSSWVRIIYILDINLLVWLIRAALGKLFHRNCTPAVFLLLKFQNDLGEMIQEESAIGCGMASTNIEIDLVCLRLIQ